jgi:hypothetical protein
MESLLWEKLFGVRRRMKWQRRPAYSVIAVVFDHS